MRPNPTTPLVMPAEPAKNDTKCPQCGATGDRWHRERGGNGWENWCSNCGYSESGT